jgi:hypothetical protein
MSILTKTGTMNSSDIDLSSQGCVSTAQQPRSSYRMKPVRREDEPLEEACEVCEAPEKDQRFQTEAPDAGAGHFYHDDREFKHGRSRG